MAFKVSREKIEQAQAAAAAAQNSGNFQSVKWLKFDGKEMTLRFMPPWTDEGPNALQFWRIVAQHWHISDSMKGPVVCPKATPGMNGECPICDFVDLLKAEETPEAKELVKEIRAKFTYLFTVIDCNDPEYTKRDLMKFQKEYPDKKEIPFKVGDPKLQVYAAPFSVYNSVMSFFKKGGDVTDLERGHDIIVSKSGSGINTKYTVTPDLTPTACAIDEDNPLINLDNVGITYTPEKLGALLSEGIGSDYEEILDKVFPAGATKALPKSKKEEEPKKLASNNKAKKEEEPKKVASKKKQVDEDDDEDEAEDVRKLYRSSDEDEDNLDDLEAGMLADDED